MTRQGGTRNELRAHADELRQLIFKTVYHADGGHIPSSFSIVELLTVLYRRILRIDPANPDWEDRDRFILSKGHACVALYAVLAQRGFFERSLLKTFCRKGSILGGHPDMLKVPGVDASTGSLGHGFPYAAGVAFSAKLHNRGIRVYSILGDGECQEGSIWEAALFAAQRQLDNLVAIVDYNKLQAIDFIDNIGSLTPFVDKWRSFGWDSIEADGHDIDQIVLTMEKLSSRRGKPKVFIAHTVKGKGVSFMENAPIWHYRMPNDSEIEVVLNELNLSRGDLDEL